MKPVVLLVDDDSSIVTAIRRALRDEGYEIHLASSGPEALTTLERRPVDVVVSDYMMPGMTGNELLTQVRQRYPDTIRIMLTGEADIQTVIQAVNEGAVYKILTKPWRNDYLRSALKEACAQAVKVQEPLVETSPHAKFCIQLLQLKESSQVVVLELRNPSILRLLSGAQLQLFLTELELIAARSYRLLGRITQLEATLFAFAVARCSGEWGKALLRDLGRPIELGGQVVSPRFAMGLAEVPEELDALAVQDALRGALVAVTATSFAGELTVFSNQIEDSLEERYSLERDMQLGLNRGEFYVKVQPQVNAQCLRIEGAETLCRWHHPVRGVVSPLKFIDLAEQNGFIHQLGAWVIGESCSIIDQLVMQGIEDLRISANVSPRQFAQSDWVEAALAFAKKTKRPEMLELEITESTVMDDPERAVAVMGQLKNAGFSLAMDDFGTGQSSLALLNQLPVDALKFDRSLVKNITTNLRSRTLFTRLIEMTHELGVKSVVEGVETQEQIELCQSVGCNLIQGFAFYRPMDVPDFYQQIKEDRYGRTPTGTAECG